MSEDYKLGEEYPALGKRVRILKGYEERDNDAEGWIWLSSFESSSKGAKKCEGKSEGEKEAE